MKEPAQDFDRIHDEIDAQHERELEALECADAKELYEEQFNDAFTQMFGWAMNREAEQAAMEDDVREDGQQCCDQEREYIEDWIGE